MEPLPSSAHPYQATPTSRQSSRFCQRPSVRAGRGSLLWASSSVGNDQPAAPGQSREWPSCLRLPFSPGSQLCSRFQPRRQAGGLPASSAPRLLPSDPRLRVWPPWLMKEGGWLKTQATSESADPSGIDLLATAGWQAHVLRSCRFAPALLV